MSSQTQAKINDLLQMYKERAVETLKGGNTMAAMYLACIAGMWANEMHRSEKPNLFESEDNLLYRWYVYGHDANREAIKSNELEAARRKRIEDSKMKNAKSSFWKLKK